MRRIIALLAASLLTGCVAPNSGTTAATRPSATMPAAVDDFRLLGRFTREATKLVEQGKTVKLAELRSQLSRKNCRIPLAAAPAESMPADTLYRQVRSGTLIVGSVFKCKKCTNWHIGACSGFAIATDVLVTNYHVVDQKDNETLVVMTPDGRVLPVRQVLAASEADDVAILMVDDGRLSPLPLAPGQPVGSHIRVISHPDNQFYTLTDGIISRYCVMRHQHNKTAVPMMCITADYAKGSSGGPVYNDCGGIVGLVASTNSIYYDDENGHHDNLQMVVKNCVPAASVLKLIDR